MLRLLFSLQGPCYLHWPNSFPTPLMNPTACWCCMPCSPHLQSCCQLCGGWSTGPAVSATSDSDCTQRRHSHSQATTSKPREDPPAPPAEPKAGTPVPITDPKALQAALEQMVIARSRPASAASSAASTASGGALGVRPWGSKLRQPFKVWCCVTLHAQAASEFGMSVFCLPLCCTCKF